MEIKQDFLNIPVRAEEQYFLNIPLNTLLNDFVIPVEIDTDGLSVYFIFDQKAIVLIEQAFDDVELELLEFFKQEKRLAYSQLMDYIDVSESRFAECLEQALYDLEMTALIDHLS